ncbi:hypothetical protein M0R89_11540 [Halorussus limi]|uniref:Uncharacterized protein n=1 Tax=Halorussus limi TaxID=2938695 RepID=A0A8U0HQF5_9EURY|nr:hypothetical protein [Halorussus limi]UPV73180.1 hypothetical protein M0R89_11540 [Halorussus limi]
MVEIDTDDVRHGAEITTDVAAGLYGLNALGFTPIQDLAAIDPTNPILGVVAILALVSLAGTAQMISEER